MWQLRLEPLKRVEIEIQISPHVEGRESRAHNFDLPLNCVSADLIRPLGGGLNAVRIVQRRIRRDAGDRHRRFPRVADSRMGESTS